MGSQERVLQPSKQPNPGLQTRSATQASHSDRVSNCEYRGASETGNSSQTSCSDLVVQTRRGASTRPAVGARVASPGTAATLGLDDEVRGRASEWPTAPERARATATVAASVQRNTVRSASGVVVIHRLRRRTPFGKRADELAEIRVARHGQYLAKFEVRHEAKQRDF